MYVWMYVRTTELFVHHRSAKINTLDSEIRALHKGHQHQNW
jgi:hypothetical protein